MIPQQAAPKVFISHASEDKQRFVEGFAQKLRNNGIDAWLDQWEISPGDDLPQSVFEKGIKSADAVIVVLSPDFVRKPWPKHELSASLIRKVRGDVRIIPVVIEKCDIPQSLQSTLWVRISDLSSYDDELKRIVMSIFEVSNKPPLGRPPEYISRLVDKVPGLSTLDTELLKYTCEMSLSTGDHLIRSNATTKFIQESGISESSAIESIEILEDRNLVKPTRTMGGGIPMFHITTHGFETYARFFIPGFSSMVDNSLIAIINHNIKTASSLADHLGQNKMMIEYVVAILDERRLISVTRTNADLHIFQVLAQGRRYAAELGNRSK